MGGEINDLQNQDILNVFNTTLIRMRADNPRTRIHDVMIVAYNTPAPRFYPSEICYKYFVGRLVRGEQLPIKSKNRIAMYNEIARRYKLLGANNPKLIESIILQPAPSFYVTFKTFRKIVYKSLRPKKE